MATPFLDAVREGDVAKAQQMLDKDASVVHSQDAEGQTALCAASAAGQLEMVQLLLKRGADVNKAGAGGAAPIHWASRAGNRQVVQQLVDAGADVNAPHESGAPLFWAAGASKPEAMEALLQAGADVNAKSQRGLTPLFMSAAVGCEDGVRTLVKHGAEVNTTALGSFTPLHVAAEGGHEGMAEALLAAGADPTARDELGHTPVKVAAARGRRGVVELLLRQAPGVQAEGAAGDVEQFMRQSKEELQAKEASMGGPEVVSFKQPEHENEDVANNFKAKANQFFAEGDYAGALKLYSLALDHWTKNATLWGNRAACYLKLGQWEGALKDARIARSIDPHYVKAWYREGKAAEALQRWEDAGTAYYTAAQLQPENDELLQLTKHVIQQGRKEHASAAAAAAAANGGSGGGGGGSSAAATVGKMSSPAHAR